MKKKRHRTEMGLKLTNKQHTGFGIASFSLGSASAIFFAVASNLTAFSNSPLVIRQTSAGLLEAAAIVLCLIGIIYGIIGETTKETYKLFANLGLLLNGVMLIVHIIVLVQGYKFS